MKLRELILLGLLVVTAAYAARLKDRANHLQADLAKLQTRHARLQENFLKTETKFMQIALNSGTKDDTFKRFLAAFESDGNVEEINVSAPDPMPANHIPSVLIK